MNNINFFYPAMVAWFVIVSGNDTDHLRMVDQILLAAIDKIILKISKNYCSADALFCDMTLVEVSEKIEERLN